MARLLPRLAASAEVYTVVPPGAAGVPHASTSSDDEAAPSSWRVGWPFWAWPGWHPPAAAGVESTCCQPLPSTGPPYSVPFAAST